MDIRIRLKQGDKWDKDIIKWLEDVPAKHRAAFIKERLYRTLKGEVVTTSQSIAPSPKPIKRDMPEEHFEALKSMGNIAF